MKNLTILTGAGISAESGIKTFRDSDGLWEGHDVMEVASPMGWHKNQELVLDFYNQRRRQLFDVQPNEGHFGLARLEEHFNVTVITQNVDDLHERAGSTNVIHLHGELLKVRSVNDPDYILDWKADLNTGDLDPNGFQLRPHIVWFGEQVPALDKAIEITAQADIFAIIGTSLQVYPAASLLHYAPPSAPVFYVDPNPAHVYDRNVTAISMPATSGVRILSEMLLRGV